MPLKSTGSKPWSGQVARTSPALELEAGVFTGKNPRQIARSLKLSALLSTRRKASAFSSAMSMLNFYINRAGRGLGRVQRQILEQAKIELKREFGGLK